MPVNEVLAQQQIKVDTGKYLKLLPHLHGTDGFFAAVFERKAETIKPKADKIVAEQNTEVLADPEKEAKPKVAKAKTVKPKAVKA